ncbi:phage protease [Chromobacterium phragmitis]|uniref:Peptidase n=1 Tax=Chromobacterium phragmitis TaxID=2202141 RepID=A0A344UFG8_9NEIS|nr:phage protease [Chromobacterium phragmitis]AXE34016.1 peptidase [Chromobacterium phragmitis]
MNATKPLHIFKSGRQTAMSGNVLDFSESDLAACARAYDPALHEAPIVIGHPKHDAPAYGWVKSLSARDIGLLAEPRQVDPAFAELVAAGRYKKISASFYRPDSPNNPVPGVYYLRHVGFLGAQPPAVKGLKPVEFGEADDGVVEFGDWDDVQNASLWRRMREWLISQFGLDTADKVIPDYTVANLEDSARQDDATRTAFADPATPSIDPLEETHVTPEQQAALEAENAQLKARLATAEAEKKAAAAATRHGEHLAYAEQLVSDGKLAPKHKDAVVAFLDFADGETSVEFGEGDAKQPLASAFKGFLGDLPKVVEFGESATKDKTGLGSQDGSLEFAERADPERLQLHQRASALAGEKNIPYEQAVRQLL